MTGIKDYSTTAASNTALFPEAMSPSDVNNGMRQVQADIREFYDTPQWRNLGNTPTYVSTTSFTISGDVTANYIVGQRIRMYGTVMGTFYGTISSSSYGAPNTTVEVTMDSGSLTSNLSAVSVGIDPTNDPIPASAISGLASASETVQGIVELATNAETITGTDTARATTPANVKAALDDRASDYATAAQGTTADSAVQPGDVIDVGSAGAFGGALLHLQDQKAAGTAGGTFTSGAWRTRTLNTEITDEIGSTLASNQFTLPAGTYYIDAEAPAFAAGVHKAKLYNITDTANVIIGSTSSSQNSSSSFSFSTIRGRFTIADTKTFEIQHQNQTTQASNGFGVAISFSVIEVYTDVKIWKVA